MGSRCLSTPAPAGAPRRRGSTWGRATRRSPAPPPLRAQRAAAAQERKLFDERFMRVDTRRMFELTGAADALDLRLLVELTSRALARIIEVRARAPARPARSRPDARPSHNAPGSHRAWHARCAACPAAAQSPDVVMAGRLGARGRGCRPCPNVGRPGRGEHMRPRAASGQRRRRSGRPQGAAPRAPDRAAAARAGRASRRRRSARPSRCPTT